MSITCDINSITGLNRAGNREAPSSHRSKCLFTLLVLYISRSGFVNGPTYVILNHTYIISSVHVETTGNQNESILHL